MKKPPDAMVLAREVRRGAKGNHWKTVLPVHVVQKAGLSTGQLAKSIMDIWIRHLGAFLWAHLMEKHVRRITYINIHY